MSTAAVMLVKDEADVIEHTVRHLFANVDEVIVADNGSTDGTREILQRLQMADVNAGREQRLYLEDDPIVGYYQAEKTTALAMKALHLGHRWVIPCDADELWIAGDGRPIRDFLDGIGREIQFVKAAIYNHVATGRDPPDEPIPFVRLGWRQRTHLAIEWGKVACRLRPDLQIAQGNHSARTQGTGATGYGLEIRHFPYRSADHFVRKAINGYAAYKATSLDEGTGAHWRMYGKEIEEKGEEAGHAWFYDAFWSEDPESDDSLQFDPAPLAVPL